ncbi:NAD(P)H-hydrate dehydratase [Roseibium sp.]|uniref:NAD(P)H-hydrate dehydratase n=1 Tax=Roseibium sp. TaxID=1936156 RepID=UPI003A97C2BC
MGRADRTAIAGGVPGIELMRTAGAHVGRVAETLCRPGGRVVVVSGPGNNGGDGFVAAKYLKGHGYPVDVWLLCEADKLRGDAAQAFQEMGFEPRPVDLAGLSQSLSGAALVIDAMFGAGLDRHLEGLAADCVELINSSGVDVLSVDLPSGVNGATGQVMGASVHAKKSITFFRLKPGHLLYPGRALRGEVKCVDIGIPDDVLSDIRPQTSRNLPGLWMGHWPVPQVNGHKYERGHAVVFSGPMHSTGAARLAAAAALRAGAGLVTVASPPSALMTNAAHLTAVMLRPVRDRENIIDLLKDRRFNSVAIGPGYGVGEGCATAVMAILGSGACVVLDADALTSFQQDPASLFEQIRGREASVVLTPHDGEFRRLFPDLAELSKLERAKKAAERSGAVVILKGPDTVIADPSGQAAINDNAPPWLATAGSGDVLAGIVTGLLAQSVPAFEAACMAVWLHGASGIEAGPGLIAEDLGSALRPVIARLVEKA